MSPLQRGDTDVRLFGTSSFGQGTSDTPLTALRLQNQRILGDFGKIASYDVNLAILPFRNPSLITVL